MNADRSGDAVRSEEPTTVEFDLSACAAPDNVERMEDYVKRIKCGVVKLRLNAVRSLTLTGLRTSSLQRRKDERQRQKGWKYTKNLRCQVQGR